ncbi:hypothetical protein V6N12_031199 [Hibiscus sabdariffa]|uniref:Uncharacterized protein n=1 Tax=Hibiscus sabdariffa TaxID=183260 RepID=A0ABR2E892_9ROSI
MQLKGSDGVKTEAKGQPRGLQYQFFSFPVRSSIPRVRPDPNNAMQLTNSAYSSLHPRGPTSLSNDGQSPGESVHGLHRSTGRGFEDNSTEDWGQFVPIISRVMISGQNADVTNDATTGSVDCTQGTTNSQRDETTGILQLE